VSLARNALLWASKNRWIEGQFRRRSFAKKAVSRFMPGERPEDALREGKALAENGIPTVVTALGENLEHLDQAEQVKDHYLDVLAMIDDQGLETHISVKLTQLGLDLNPVVTMEHLRSLAAAASLRRNTLWVDIEESHYAGLGPGAGRGWLGPTGEGRLQRTAERGLPQEGGHGRELLPHGQEAL
jgi:proline dehydrogenase